MRHTKFLNVFLIVFNAIFVFNTLGQNNPAQTETNYSLSYAEFLNKLAKQNLDYAAEKYTIQIAAAEREAAKIVPDPELSFKAYDNQERRLKLGYGFEAELEWDLELGGKRKARKTFAQEKYRLTGLKLEKYFHKLRRKSTLAFLKAVKNKMLYDLQKESLETMLDLAEQDSLRYAAGEIEKSAARLIKLEAGSLHNDLEDTADEWQYSLLKVKSLISTKKYDMVYIPKGDLNRFDRVFNLEELIKKARENYPDLRIAEQNTAVAQRKIKLAEAERVIDLGLSIGVENNAFAKNIIGPTPGFTSVFAGVSVPLKFSNNREAKLKTAYYEEQQAQLKHTAKMLRLKEKITRAFQNYRTKQKQITSIKTDIREAREIFEEEKEGYLKNQSSLWAVLNAQKLYYKLQKDYINTLYKHASALVKLESTVGIWDIDF